VSEEIKKMGRLAFREEGPIWAAYWAEPTTMDGAVFIGSIAMRCVRDPQRKREFMTLMKVVVSDLLEETFGAEALWPEGEQPAPEHERAKDWRPG